MSEMSEAPQPVQPEAAKPTAMPTTETGQRLGIGGAEQSLTLNALAPEQSHAGASKSPLTVYFEQAKEQRLKKALAESTPAEQQDILMIYNKDWRAWLTVNGAPDSQQQFIAEMKPWYENTDNMTPTEEKMLYWRHVSGMLDMKSADMLAGIESGLIKDPEALKVYAAMRLAEARRERDVKMIGSDTEEQGRISALAVEEYNAVEKELAPLLHGTPEDQAQYCREKSQTWDSLAGFTQEQHRTLGYLRDHPTQLAALSSLQHLDADSLQTLIDTLEQVKVKEALQAESANIEKSSPLIDLLLTLIQGVKDGMVSAAKQVLPDNQQTAR